MKGLFKKIKDAAKFVSLPFVLLIEGIVLLWKLSRWSEEADEQAELDEWRSWYE